MIQAQIRKGFGRFSLDLDLQAGSGTTVLFGPSGAGKTLTLDCVAGFVRPDQGRIVLDGEVLFDRERGIDARPQARRTGYVLQNYALFPHMTLRQNLDFAAERLPRPERRRRVGELLEQFRLSEIAGQRPHELSGGQKQRCSIARALVGSPRLLLLDEPARGLDASLRAEFYAVLRQVRADFGTPMLLVTHDLDECFELADEMLAMRDGRVVQSGSPREVARRPANVEVARLLGLYNLMHVEIVRPQPGLIRYGGFELSVPDMQDRRVGEMVWLYTRAESLKALPRNGRPGANQLPVKLLRVVEKPHSVRLEFAGDIAVETASVDPTCKDWLIEFDPGAFGIL